MPVLPGSRSRLGLAALLVLASPAFGIGAANHGATVYVSPRGLDSSPGTRARPFRTVERARDAVRASRRQGGRQATVELAGGTYRLRRTLTLGPEDSGSPGRPITWRAAPGQRVVLSGGRPVSGWTRDTGGRWKAHVDLPNFRQLWVNGRRAQRSRGPVPAGLQPWGSQDFVIHPKSPGSNIGTVEVIGEAGYRTPHGEATRWRHPEEMEFGYTNAWSHMICPIASVRPDQGGAIIVMRQPCFLLASRKGGVQAGMPEYVENALELLDKPGEWFFDRHSRTLTYMPRKGEEMRTAAVVAPELETLARTQGAHDIAFAGITFAHATWLRPSAFGHPDVQANCILTTESAYRRPEIEQGLTCPNGDCEKSPANVVVGRSDRVSFRTCTFTALGGAGLDIEDGSRSCLADRCRFNDISASGVQVGGAARMDHHPTGGRPATADNSITNCVITDCGVEYQDSIGIWCGYTSRTTLAHNEISRLPYTGISVGWGWGMPDVGGGGYYSSEVFTTPTTSLGNRIEYNHIHHVMLKRSDGGGIYTLSRQPGTILRGNHIHDNGPGVPGGIYLDEGSADIEVTGNPVYGVAVPMNYNNRAQNRIATCREHDNLFGLSRTVDGIAGRAHRFAAGTRMDVPDAPGFDAPQLTVEAWVRLAELPGGKDPRRWIVCKGMNEWDNGNYSLVIDGANVSAYIDIGGGLENSYEVTGKRKPLRRSRWHHVAMTYDGTTLRAYCDGQVVASKPVGKPRTSNASPLSIAGRLDGFSPGYLSGDIDELGIYSRALSVDEIRRNITAARSGKPGSVVRDGLVRHWSFEDADRSWAVAERIIRAAGPTR